MPLEARFKPCWARSVPNAPAAKHKEIRILCGHPACPGELGSLDLTDWAVFTPPEGPKLWLAPGFVNKDGVWRLGNHAARRHDRQPRRPRLYYGSSAERAYRSRFSPYRLVGEWVELGLYDFGSSQGKLFLPDGFPAELAQRALNDKHHHRKTSESLLDRWETVTYGERIVMECPQPQCRRISEFVVRPFEEMYQEGANRRRARQA